MYLYPLLLHSMGAFVAAAYALCHPDKVSHLILADPWGFSTRPSNAQGIAFKMLQRLSKLNPLGLMRSSGPALGGLSSVLINRNRNEIQYKIIDVWNSTY